MFYKDDFNGKFFVEPKEYEQIRITTVSVNYVTKHLHANALSRKLYQFLCGPIESKSTFLIAYPRGLRASLRHMRHGRRYQSGQEELGMF